MSKPDTSVKSLTSGRTLTVVTIKLKMCDDIRCFDKPHLFCPKPDCCGILHLLVEPESFFDNVEISGCKNPRSCWNTQKVRHINCPDCGKPVHVQIAL
jgi:ribosomal protein S27E